MSGIFGAFSTTETPVLEEVYLGLYALQHRGQEAAGIAWPDNGRISSSRGLGLLHDALSQQKLAEIPAYSAIAHVSCSPLDLSQPQNILPLSANYARGLIAISHDGCITNLPDLTKDLEERGSIFHSTTDSEAILHLIAQEAHMQPIEALVSSLKKLKGSSSLLVLLENELVAFRDPWGFKPLCLGQKKNTYYLASESCALDIVGAKLIRDINPGEIVIIDKNGIKSLNILTQKNTERRMKCSFEYVYTARPDSVIDGRSVYKARKEMGRRLAIKSPCPNADIAAGTPDSGTISAIGYSEESKTPFELAVVRNRYVGRTFIQPTQKVRELGVKIKLNPISDVFENKKTVIIDDSIVRGTTAQSIISMIRNSGAKEVHLRVASPPVIFPCKYSVDSRKEKSLAAVKMSLEELCKKINADSLGYLTEEDLIESIGIPKEQLCTACFTGEYLQEDAADEECGNES